MTERSNEEWLSALSQSGPERELALADLRSLLVRGLGYAMADRQKVGEDDLQDFSQEALLKILNGLDSFRGESLFITWAQKIAVRVAFTELRRRRWRDVSLDELTESVGDLIPRNLEGQSTSPEQETAQRLVLGVLRRMIEEQLTEKQRRAMTAVLQGMPLGEVARRMGTNTNALYKLLHDARQRLQAQMLDEGMSAEDLLTVFDT